MDLGRPWVLRGIVIALAVVVAIIAWVATSGDDGGDGSSTSAGSGMDAKIVSEGELADFAATAGHPVYWAGPIEGAELELSEDKAGNVTVRYLSEGAEVGTDRVRSLAVGSYPLEDPMAELDAFAESPGAIVGETSEGEKMVSNEQAPGSVYFVNPENTVQIEVYTPSPQRSMKLVRSGGIEPVG